MLNRIAARCCVSLFLCVLPNCGKNLTSENPKPLLGMHTSHDFAWLPFEIAADDDSAATFEREEREDTQSAMRGNGKVIVQGGASASMSLAAVLQTDRKMVSLGSTSGANTNFIIFRQNTDGTFDTAFNSTGKVITDLGDNDAIYAGVLQSDEKIVAVGQAGNDFGLTRYNTDGTLDTTFNSTGKVITDLSGTDTGYAGALQNNGKIVVVGTSSTYITFGLARYNTDGTLDTAFNSTGKVITSLGVPETDAYAEILQSDGKIVALGTTNNGIDFGLARYNTDGTLDTSFNSTGKVITDLDADEGYDTIYGGILQSDGKIVALGTTTSNTDFALVRYHTDGTLDTSFNSTGKVITNISGIDVVYGGALQADGKIIAVGATANYVNDGLARYNTDGTLDTSFNSTGKRMNSFEPGNSTMNALVLESTGNIIGLGSTNPTADFMLVRLNAQGALNTSFNSTGILVTNINGLEVANVGVLQTNGKIVAVGVITANFGLARYNTNGTLDTSFNSTGKVSTDINGSDIAYGGILLSDGKIVAIGTANIVDFALTRYNTNGTLDTSFNSTGKVTTDISGTDIGYVGVLQSDGKIIVVGSTTNTANFGLARYNTNGTLDTSFNSTGKVITNISGTDVAYGGVLQSDEKIVVAGATTDTANFGLARYNTNGTLDTSFNSTGKVITNISGTDVAKAIQAVTSGKLVVAGYSNIFFSVARYLSSGNLDTTFHTSGTLVLSVGEGTSAASTLAIGSNGYYFVGGSAILNNVYGFAFVKIAP